MNQVPQLYGTGVAGICHLGAEADAPHSGKLRRPYSRITNAHDQWPEYSFDCGRDALSLERVMGGGDSGGPVLIKSGGTWKLARVAHGLDGNAADVSSLRAGTFRMGTRGQTFAKPQTVTGARSSPSAAHTAADHERPALRMRLMAGRCSFRTRSYTPALMAATSPPTAQPPSTSVAQWTSR